MYYKMLLPLYHRLLCSQPNAQIKIQNLLQILLTFTVQIVHVFDVRKGHNVTKGQVKIIHIYIFSFYRISPLSLRSCDFFSTDITSVIDVASEQRCVVVVADGFVIVLGLQMFTKLLRFSPL